MKFKVVGPLAYQNIWRERVRERKIALPLNVLKDLAHVQVIHIIDVGIQNY